jgi:hypothetical protein
MVKWEFLEREINFWEKLYALNFIKR